MTKKRRYQVFVSSTYEDLIEERAVIYDVLLRNDCIPAGMELFGAVDQDQFEFIKTVIDESDYYLVIVAARYGTLTNEGISYTEKEYDYAVQKRIPVSALIHENPQSIESGKTDTDPELFKRLNAFKEKLSSGRLRDFWRNREDLAQKVAQSIKLQIEKNPRPGWVRDNDVSEITLIKNTNTSETKTEDNQELEIYSLEDYPFPEIQVMLICRNGNKGSNKEVTLDLADLFFWISSEIATPLVEFEFQRNVNAYLKKDVFGYSTIELRQDCYTSIKSHLFNLDLINIESKDIDGSTHNEIVITNKGLKLSKNIQRKKIKRPDYSEILASFKKIADD